MGGTRRGKRWGVTMDLSKRTVVEGATPLASELHMLIARMQSIPLLSNFRPNEANAIDYRKPLGHWLKPHVDDRFVCLQCYHTVYSTFPPSMSCVLLT